MVILNEGIVWCNEPFSNMKKGLDDTLFQFLFSLNRNKGIDFKKVKKLHRPNFLLLLPKIINIQ